MKVETCRTLGQITNQLNDLLQASHDDWHSISPTETSITNEHITQFLSNNFYLLRDNRNKFVKQLDALTDRINTEYEDGKTSINIIKSIKKTAEGIFLPEDVVTHILKEGTTALEPLEVTKLTSRGASVSKSFAKKSEQAKANFINRNHGKINYDLGLEDKEEVKKLITSCGQYITHLSFDSATDPELFRDFTDKDLIEILKNCPNLVEVNLNITELARMSISAEVWEVLNTLKNLKQLKIKIIPGITIPAITSSSLQKIDIVGHIRGFEGTLPPQLKHLRLIHTNPQGIFRNLPETLPPNLETLDVKHMQFQTDKPVVLPDTLTTLSGGGFNEANLPTQWPPNLRVLRLSIYEGTEIPKLPQSLDSLILHLCDNLRLPDLPNKLRKLEIFDCSEIATINEVPDSLEELKIIQPQVVVTLSLNILFNIRSLFLTKTTSTWKEIIENSPKLEIFKIVDQDSQSFDVPLPLNLKEVFLNMSSLENFQLSPLPNLERFEILSNLPPRLAVLPPKLKQLSTTVKLETKLPGFPQDIESIEFEGMIDCITLQDLHKLSSVKLPEQIRGLIIKNCPRINSNILSQNELRFLAMNNDNLRVFSCNNYMQILDLSGSTNLSKIANLENSLVTHLKLAGCSNLRKITEVPSTLEVIDIDGCSKLKEMDFSDPSEFVSNLKVIEGEFSEGLQKLNLRGCRKLEIAPKKLPSSLIELDLTGVPHLHIWSDTYLKELQEKNPKLVIKGMLEPIYEVGACCFKGKHSAIQIR